jgi:hypothetical protein
MAKLFDVVKFDYIPKIDEINEFIYGLKSEALSPAFEEIGYEQMYMIPNVGSMLIMIDIFLLSFIIFKLLSCFPCTREWALKRLDDPAYSWITLTKFILENHLLLTITSMLNVKYII